MKKQALLSLMTVGTIITTSAVSYAAWDTTTATSNGSLTVAKPVEVTSLPLSAFTTSALDTITNAPIYEATVEFGVADDANAVNKLTLETAIKDAGADVTSKFTISYEEGGTKLTGGVDETITKGSTKNTYTIKITPLDTVDAKALAGKSLSVDVTGEVGKK